MLTFQLVRTILANQLVQVVATIRAQTQPGLVHQVGEIGQGGPGYRHRGVTRAASTEDRELAQHGAFGRGEHLPGMVKDGDHAAMARRHIVQRGRQQLGPRSSSCAMSFSASARVHAAASSIPSGMPSSSRQMWAMMAASCAAGVKPGRTRRVACRNRCVAL